MYIYIYTLAGLLSLQVRGGEPDSVAGAGAEVADVLLGVRHPDGGRPGPDLGLVADTWGRTLMGQIGEKGTPWHIPFRMEHGQRQRQRPGPGRRAGSRSSRP